MDGQERTPEQKAFALAERRRIVAERYLRGQTQYQIAQALEVHAGTISRDLAAVQKEWLDAKLRDFDAAKAQELAKIDLVEREALSAWERSKAERTASRTRKRTGRTAGDEAEVRREQRDGNPRFIELVIRCVDLRCRILGMVEKRKAEEDQPADRDGTPALTLEDYLAARRRYESSSPN